MIRFRCPACGAVLTVDDRRAGRKAPCPKCGQRLEVPRSSASDAESGVSLPSPTQTVPAPAPADRPNGTRRALWQLPALAGGLAFVLLAVLFGVIGISTQQPTASAIGWALCFAAAIAVIVGSALLGAGTHRRCPHCKRWWARVKIGREILKQERCYGLVTRTAHSSSSGSYYGNRSSSDGGTVFSSGATSWQERVPVIRTTYELQYECRYCQARWTRNVEKEVEDFDRP